MKEPYYLSTSTVTQAQWRTALPVPPGMVPADDEFPIHAISWHQSNEFAQLLGMRLPTSAEWELACRAGTRTPYSCGGTLPHEHGNCDLAGGYDASLRAGTLRKAAAGVANPWGFVNMHGNLWEWCADQVPEFPGHRIRRGGSYVDPASRCTSDTIDHGPEDRSGWMLVGLRTAWSPPAY